MPDNKKGYDPFSRRIGVLISGRGSNLQSIIDAIGRGELDATVAVVISNRADAPGLLRAREAGIDAIHLNPPEYADRIAYDRAIVESLNARDVGLVCLAGFMRLVGPPLLDAFPNRILNIHPSLLPSFRGVDAQRQAFEHGVKVTGATNPHGSTTALAFRLDEGDRSFVYASDVGYPDEGPGPESLALYRGATLLLHDTTYTPEHQARRRNRGFSSYEDAASAAVLAGARHLVMFHYDQDYSDDDVDALRAACRASLDRRGGQAIGLTAAAEGLEIEI